MQETVITTDGEWREHAACLEHPAVLFFGLEDNESSSERKLREEEAKRVCCACEVKQDCLEYALEMREPYGIWGGLTEVERRSRLHRRSN